MIYVIGFPAEIQAMQLLEPYGYARILPRPPGQSWDDYGWNQVNAMVGGSNVILSYTNGIDPKGNPARVPVFETTYFWCCLINPQTHEDLFQRFSGQPIIEIDEKRTGTKPSDFITRAYHLSFDPNTIKGLSPLWAGMPNIGFPYDRGA